MFFSKLFYVYDDIAIAFIIIDISYLQILPVSSNDTAIRVLSIRIEKKVNYFYEVTTSD